MGDGRSVHGGLVIFVLALSGTIVALVQTLVVPLLPELPGLLGTSASNVSWLVTVTLLASAVTTPIVSKLADMFGKRRMMLCCLAALVTGSVVGALSASLPGVIAARGLQGFAPALIPVGISIMRDELPPDRMAAGVALMSATIGIGGAIGLPLSGAISSVTDWHAVFWLSGGMAAVVLLLLLLVVPESAQRSGGRFDVVGAALLSVALTMLLLAISMGQQWGWGSDLTRGCFVSAAIVGVAWVPWELRTDRPLVDIRSSLRRTVLLTNVAAALAGFAMFANMLSTTQQLQLPRDTGAGFGLTATQAGLAMLPGGLSMLLLAPVAAAISRRCGPRTTLLVGTVVMAVGYLARIALHREVWQVIFGASIVSIGTALSFAAMPVLIMLAVPANESAAANGLNTLLRTIGTAVSSAALAAILAEETVVAAGRALPSPTAFRAAFLVAASAAAAAAVLGAFLPRRPRRTVAAGPAAHALNADVSPIP
jgi:EmrB/QacA subfamily drug resistance transporter